MANWPLGPIRFVALSGLAIVAAAFFMGLVGLRQEPRSAEAAFLSEVRKLLLSDPGGTFGFSVAVDGDTAVISAWNDDTGGAEAGAVYVLQRDQGGAENWGQVRKLLASDAQAGDLFGVNVSIDGDTAVVGAYYEDSGGDKAGAAYVFERDHGGADNWGETQKLIASDAQAGDWFGISVDISGDTCIVGAVAEDGGGVNNTGAAYVFQRDEGGSNNWGELKKLTASNAGKGDGFGRSVAVDGNTAVAGARAEDTGAGNGGAAYVFRRNQGGADNWGEVRKLIASDAEANDRLGSDLALDSDTLVVGAIEESSVANRNGAAYVFGRDEGGAGNWGEVKKLVASDAGDVDWFGEAIAISGDNIVVGTRVEDAGGFGAGAGYAFQRNQGGANNWGEVSKLTASDAERQDNFGVGVGVSGNTAIIGAWLEDSAGKNAGAAYVFDLMFPKPPTRTPKNTATSTSTPTVTPTSTITSTPAPTATPTPPVAVGGIALEAEAGLRPLGIAESSSSRFGVLVWTILAGAALVVLGGAAWFARRRVAG